MKHTLPLIIAAGASLCLACCTKSDISTTNGAKIECTVSLPRNLFNYGTAALNAQGKTLEFSDADTSVSVTFQYSGFPARDSIQLMLVRDSTKVPTDTTSGVLGHKCVISGWIAVSDGTTTSITQSINDQIDSIKTFSPFTRETVDSFFVKNNGLNVLYINLQ